MSMENNLKKDPLKVELKSTESCFVEISVLDQLGGIIYNFSRFISKGIFKHEVETNRLKPGSYILRVAKNGRSKIETINI